MNKPVEVKQIFLTPNEYTRPMRTLISVDAIVVHWVELAGGSNEGLFNWFNNHAPKQKRHGSTHFGIDDNGVVQFMPLTEMAYHVGAREYTEWKQTFFESKYPNAHTIGIELNHVDWEGRFSEKVLDFAVELSAWLCREYNLNPMKHIIRHFDVTGKNCPKWFVDHPDEFDEFKTRVRDTL